MKLSAEMEKSTNIVSRYLKQSKMFLGDLLVLFGFLGPMFNVYYTEKPEISYDFIQLGLYFFYFSLKLSNTSYKMRFYDDPSTTPTI